MFTSTDDDGDDGDDDDDDDDDDETGPSSMILTAVGFRFTTRTAMSDDVNIDVALPPISPSFTCTSGPSGPSKEEDEKAEEL